MYLNKYYYKEIKCIACLFIQVLTEIIQNLKKKDLLWGPVVKVVHTAIAKKNQLFSTLSRVRKTNIWGSCF